MIHWKRGAHLQLSPHFNSDEFECQCGRCEDQFVSELLITKLELTRGDFGQSIRVTSGLRCHAHQDELRAQGYETATGPSEHELGGAADIRPEYLDDMPKLEKSAAKYFKAIGTARTFLHVDRRADKIRRWTYTKR